MHEQGGSFAAARTSAMMSRKTVARALPIDPLRRYCTANRISDWASVVPENSVLNLSDLVMARDAKTFLTNRAANLRG
jgi:hypothetical protein